MVIVMTMMTKMQNTRNDEDGLIMVITMTMMMMMINLSFSLTFAVCRERDSKEPLEHLKTDDCHHENGQEPIKWSLFNIQLRQESARSVRHDH